jgi:ribosomal protein L34E
VSTSATATSATTTDMDDIQAAIRARQAMTRRETVVDRPYDGRLCATCAEAVLGKSIQETKKKKKKKKKKRK